MQTRPSERPGHAGVTIGLIAAALVVSVCSTNGQRHVETPSTPAEGERDSLSKTTLPCPRLVVGADVMRLGDRTIASVAEGRLVGVAAFSHPPLQDALEEDLLSREACRERLGVVVDEAVRHEVFLVLLYAARASDFRRVEVVSASPGGPLPLRYCLRVDPLERATECDALSWEPTREERLRDPPPPELTVVAEADGGLRALLRGGFQPALEPSVVLDLEAFRARLVALRRGYADSMSEERVVLWAHPLLLWRDVRPVVALLNAGRGDDPTPPMLDFAADADQWSVRTEGPRHWVNEDEREPPEREEVQKIRSEPPRPR